MIRKEINFYGGNFEPICSVEITRPVPDCWEPGEDVEGSNAIQAVSNGIIIGQASRVYGGWHYNLVGGPGHLPEVGASNEDSIKEIVAFFCEALLLSEKAS